MKGTVNPEKCRLGVLCLLHIAPGVPTEPQDSKKYSQKKKKKKAFAVFKIPLYKQQNLSLADLGRKGIYLLEYSEGF